MCECKCKQQEWPADAPGWANYMATDETGAVWFYENKPFPDKHGHLTWQVDGGRHKLIRPESRPNWRDSLIERPKPVLKEWE
jgi:hypothetical protein